MVQARRLPYSLSTSLLQLNSPGHQRNQSVSMSWRQGDLLTKVNKMIIIILWCRIMRYPAEHKEETRERIVQAAARRFRSRGNKGTVIGDLMRDLHLTHGGFYRHFGSKEELFAEALEHSLEQFASKVLSTVENAPQGSQLKALIDSYFDVEHCEDAAGGCPVAALATEIARHPPKARAALLRVLKNHIARVAKYIPGATEEARERKARVLFSGMAGTLTLARVIVDDRERRRFLDDAKKFYFDAARQ